MKKSLKFVLAALIVGVLGIVAAWFAASGNAVSNVEQHIARVNENSQSKLSTIKITYERIKRASFPAVGAQLINPVLEYSTLPVAQGAPTSRLQWKYTGAVTLITDYLQHAFRFASKGNSTTTVESGSEKVTFISQPSRMNIELHAKNAAAFQIWNQLTVADNTALKAAAKELAALRIEASPITLKDEAGNVLFTQEKTAIFLNNRSTETQIDFDLVANILGSEMTQAYSDAIDRALTIMQWPLPPSTEDTPLSIVRAGKQNMEVDLKVDVPITAQRAPATSGSIRLTKFVLKNNFYDLRMPATIAISQEEGRQKLALKTDWSLLFTPAGAAEMQRVVGVSGQALPMIGAPATSAEAMQQKISDALPSVSNLGPIKFALDFEASVPAKGVEQPDVPGPQEMLTIRNLNLDHARWGLDISGQAQRNQKAPPLVDLSIICKRCEIFTQDIFVTARQLQDIMRLIDPTRTLWNMSEERQQQVSQLLADIGKKDAQTGDIRFAIGTPEAGDVRINDRPAAEVMAKIMAVFVPTPPAAPPAP